MKTTLTQEPFKRFTCSKSRRKRLTISELEALQEVTQALCRQALVCSEVKLNLEWKKMAALAKLFLVSGMAFDTPDKIPCHLFQETMNRITPLITAFICLRT